MSKIQLHALSEGRYQAIPDNETTNDHMPRLSRAGAFVKYLKEYITEGILSLIYIMICGKILVREFVLFLTKTDRRSVFVI